MILLHSDPKVRHRTTPVPLHRVCRGQVTLGQVTFGSTLVEVTLQWRTRNPLRTKGPPSFRRRVRVGQTHRKRHPRSRRPWDGPRVRDDSKTGFVPPSLGGPVVRSVWGPWTSSVYERFVFLGRRPGSTLPPESRFEESESLLGNKRDRPLSDTRGRSQGPVLP